MDIGAVASVSVVVQDQSAATKLYRDVLDISFEGGTDDYVFTEKLPGIKHFGLWPLHEAAQACFGSVEWPDEHPRPQASIEFEVGSVSDVAAAVEKLTAAGYALLHGSKEEPWGQTITRLISNEGLIIGVCFTPWFHE